MAEERTDAILPQSSPSLCGYAKPCARDISPLYSPSLHHNLCSPLLISLLVRLYRLTSAQPSCLDVLIPDHEAIESDNS